MKVEKGIPMEEEVKAESTKTTESGKDFSTGKEEKPQDLSRLYTDETQAAVEILKKEAAQARKDEKPYTAGDVVHDSIFFVLTAAGAFGWLMLVLLIISFVGLGYVHITLKQMLLWSALFAVAVAGFYLFRMARKYSDLNHRGD